jgi:DtxR family transcriptional regulator, Mn-dependent transcriptional regulator
MSSGSRSSGSSSSGGGSGGGGSGSGGSGGGGHTTTVEHHPPLEEYLQTIETLTEEGAPVIQARIAERLGKSAPSVSEMLDRLTTDGYVDRSGRQIALTAEGHAVARSVIRKHRLAECLLVDVIGLPWHLVHEEAGRWEHVMSDDVEERLIVLLGDPATCPHGNPIPGSANRVSTTSTQVRLADVEDGQRVRFERMTEEIEQDGASLRYLNDVGFIPGTSATVTTKAPDGTCILEVEGETVALGREFAQRLFVVAV